MKIVYLVEYPVGRRDHERFGMATMRSNGLGVEIWDMTAVIHPQVAAANSLADAIPLENQRAFSTFGEGVTEIRSAGRNVIFMTILGYSLRHLPLYRAMAASKAMIGFLSALTMPAPTRVQTSRRLLTSVKSFSRLSNAIFRRTTPRLWGIRHADFVLAGGRASLNMSHPLVGPATAIVRAHTLDYDIFLSSESEPSPIAGKYAIFIDQYWPFHTDWMTEGLPSPVEPTRYYASLGAFFDRFEREVGCPVVIAVHPRSRYEQHCDVFGGRKLVSGKTALAVRDATAVIAHDSVALNFANLYRRPVIFLKPDLHPMFNRSVLVDEMAAAFGKVPLPLYHLPKQIDWTSELIVSGSAYDRYRDAYIKIDGTPQRPAWTIWADYLKSTPAAELGSDAA